MIPNRFLFIATAPYRKLAISNPFTRALILFPQISILPITSKQMLPLPINFLFHVEKWYYICNPGR